MPAITIHKILRKCSTRETSSAFFFPSHAGIDRNCWDLSNSSSCKEYDHIEGKLFIDYLKPLKRKLLKGKLDDITKGKIKVDYKMVFPK